MATETTNPVAAGPVVPAAMPPDPAAEQARLKRELFARLGWDKYLARSTKSFEELSRELGETWSVPVSSRRPPHAGRSILPGGVGD